jgi:Fe(3+) dicitrate transport protein
VSALALCAMACAAPAVAQEADPSAADAVLPEIEVQTAPAATKQKYPTAPVAKKKSSAPASSAAPTAPATASSTTSQAPSAPANSSNAVPAVATTGTIVGDRKGILNMEGSAAVVDSEELYTSHVFTTNEALRKVPGIVVRDEEGFGIRPNIGIRGMNPTRSTKTLLLEDGLFLSYSPYGDNASYFHPPMDRFSSVEVFKGTDMLRFGPQTIAGTINYVTPTPPRDPAGFVAGTVGNRDYFNGQLNYGGWVGNFGGMVDYIHKEGQGARDNTHHEIDDVTLKGVAQISPESALIAKFNYFREDSQVGYTGITDAELREFGIRYNPFENDTFNTERVGLSLTHNWDLNDAVSVATSVYYTSFDREWYRQSSTTTDTMCGPANTTPSRNFVADRAAGIAVDPNTCNQNQGRNRYYDTTGVQQNWSFENQISDAARNLFQAGWRYHVENQERFQINSFSPTARPGPGAAVPGSGNATAGNQILLVEDNERDTTAFSLWASNTFEYEQFSITPIARFESIDNGRQNNIVTGGPPQQQCASPPCFGSDEITEFIPGISVGYEVNERVRLFAGVHEGFAPPRVEDLIGNSGDSASGTGVGSVEVEPESSINLEVGFKSEVIPGLVMDGTYFRNDFSNLIAVGSIAGGGVPLAQGEALFEGFEFFARVDSGRLMRTDWSVYSSVAWTYLWTAEQTTGFLRVDNGNPVVPGGTAGNRNPYAPEHTVTARIGYQQRNFDINLEMVYVGEQFADFQNFGSPGEACGNVGATSGVDNCLSGQFGKIDAQTIFNFGTTYTYEPTNTDIFFTVKNLFDDDYIVDRTRGILPGMPRLIHVGVKQDF